MREKIIDIIREIVPTVDIEHSEDLMDNGDLDSFDIINLVGELMEEFDVNITADLIVPENFNSFNLIVSLVERLQKEE